MKYLISLLLMMTLVFIPLMAFEVEKEAAITPADLKFNARDDFLKSMEWAYKGSYKQFERTQNLLFFGIAALSTIYFIRNDDRLSALSSKRNKNEKLLRNISDASIFFNTPILPAVFYSIGVSNKDEKMVRFSQEYLAALTLTLVETAAISIIPVHQRPDGKELSFWEKAFRGQSSFPSGHVVGYAILASKSFQFYGPHYGLIPLGLTLAVAYERVHSEKHFASDVVASGFLSFLASEGVRYASDYKGNHPIYEWFFNHDFSMDYIRKDNIPGLRFSFTY